MTPAGENDVQVTAIARATQASIRHESKILLRRRKQRYRPLTTCHIIMQLNFLVFGTLISSAWNHCRFVASSLLLVPQSKSLSQWQIRVRKGSFFNSFEQGQHAFDSPQSQRLASNDESEWMAQKNDTKMMHILSDYTEDVNRSSRRRALTKIVAAMSTIPATSLLLAPPPAQAGKPEFDTKSGELFSPKAQMLNGGGSDMARGIKLEARTRNTQTTAKKNRKSDEVVQSVYNTRFIAYLSRFLLNFDPAAMVWWGEQEAAFLEKKGNLDVTAQRQLRFAEFAESVELGLADYFVGPYGSYASVQAAKAGLTAVTPAPSKSTGLLAEKNFFSSFSFLLRPPVQIERDESKTSNRKKRKRSLKEEKIVQAKLGVVNLFALLKARYTSSNAKCQLAILFSLILDPRLQPVAEIKALLGEHDNATVSEIKLEGLPSGQGDNFRASSREGGGYSLDSPPKVVIEYPPALGDQFRPAKALPTMKVTTRILRIRVVDGGRGYTSIATITVKQGGVKRDCQAVAIMGRDGTVESITVLDPGLGYGGVYRSHPVLPEVLISSPRMTQQGKKRADALFRTAKAVAELEYAICGVDVIEGGSGYESTQPPKVIVTPPEEDPDWFVPPLEEKYWRRMDDHFVTASLSLTAQGNGRALNMQDFKTDVNSSVLVRMKYDPLMLIPNKVRPVFIQAEQCLSESSSCTSGAGSYTIPSLPPADKDADLPSARYRAFDSIFGGVGIKPVTRGARELSVSEYFRLALSGAVCTVIVRTALSPLELVKTKIQLENDKELADYALKKYGRKGKEKDKNTKPVNKRKSQEPMKERTLVSIGGKDDEIESESQRSKKVARGPKVSVDEERPEPSSKRHQHSSSTASKVKEKVGTLSLIRSLIELRGPLALFQSADITFLASLVFGSFGFGGTELFRRSFSVVVFHDNDGEGSGGGQELVLLAAAVLAGIVTSAVATPFEMMRVRSMGYLEPADGKTVLADFLDEKRRARSESQDKEDSTSESTPFRFKDLTKDDLAPLWGGFGPIASRDLPFSVAKFLAFDIVTSAMITVINSQLNPTEPVEVGIGTTGLIVSAFGGAIAGLAGAFVSHPADLVLTLTSSRNEKGGKKKDNTDWRPIVQDLMRKDGGMMNLFTGLSARASFFFLVIGLQFFLYDYVKNLFQVGTEDLTLVLDVFYAIRQGLIHMDN